MRSLIGDGRTAEFMLLEQFSNKLHPRKWQRDEQEERFSRLTGN